MDAKRKAQICSIIDANIDACATSMGNSKHRLLQSSNTPLKNDLRQEESNSSSVPVSFIPFIDQHLERVVCTLPALPQLLLVPQPFVI